MPAASKYFSFLPTVIAGQFLSYYLAIALDERKQYFIDIKESILSKKNLKVACNKLENYIDKGYLNQGFSSLDIRFIMQVSKGTIRLSKRIEYEIAKHYNGKINKLEKLYLVVLQSAIYQIDYMSNVPDYAVVSTAVDITKMLFPKYAKLTNALLRNMISNRMLLKLPDVKDSIEYLSIFPIQFEEELV